MAGARAGRDGQRVFERSCRRRAGFEARDKEPHSAFVPHERQGAVLPIEQVISTLLRPLSVVDRPGTLARIAAIFAKAKIGISSVIQPEGHEGDSVPLTLMIHDASNAAMAKAWRRSAACRW
jgi:homoserine dehydrogenase